MSGLPITFACGFYDRMHALYTGDVKPAGIDLNFMPIDDPRQIFDRMGGGLEFDASEMSLSEHITKLIAGNSPFVAVPVMTVRGSVWLPMAPVAMTVTSSELSLKTRMRVPSGLGTM